MPKGSVTFSLPAGYSCPFAGKCYSKVPSSGVLVPGLRYVCRAASEELTESHRRLRWFNFNKLKTTGDDVDAMVSLIATSLPEADTVVLHRSGDFFSENYFLAWMLVANDRESTNFLIETTSIPYWVEHKKLVPPNVTISANLDTTKLAVVKQEGLPFHAVVFSREDASDYGLPVGHKLDKLQEGTNYATLIRSMQVAGTEAGKGVEALRTGRALTREVLTGSSISDYSIPG